MVAASHRRRGIGTALLDAAVQWGREAGVRKLELHVFPWNAAAIALYERYGFVKEGYRRGHYRPRRRVRRRHPDGVRALTGGGLPANRCR